jgi:hypothetical protein
MLGPELFERMLDAFKQQLSIDFSHLNQESKSLIETQLHSISANLIKISKLRMLNEIDAETATELLAVQHDVAKMQLLAIEGVSKIMLQNAINAASNVAKKAISKALGVMV